MVWQGLVHGAPLLFTKCLPSVCQVFTKCSPSVPFLFTKCSLCVPFLFPLCSLSVPFLFPFCSLSVPGPNLEPNQEQETGTLPTFTRRVPKGSPLQPCDSTSRC